MSTKQYDKFAIGDVGYLYPSTAQQEGRAGKVIKIDPAGGQDAPHIWFENPAGKVIQVDYQKIGSAGPPRPATGFATVKWLFDPERWEASGGLSGKPSIGEDHLSWKILAVAGVEDEYNDYRWALVECEFSGRQHWLPKNEKYSFSVVEGGRSHEVCLEGIPPRL